MFRYWSRKKLKIRDWEGRAGMHTQVCWLIIFPQNHLATNKKTLKSGRIRQSKSFSLNFFFPFRCNLYLQGKKVNKSNCIRMLVFYKSFDGEAVERGENGKCTLSNM